MDAVDEFLDWNYHSARAQKARLSVRVHGFVGFIKAIIWILVLLGIALLLMSMSVGWLLISLGVLPWMLVKWHDNELHHLPTGKGSSVDDLMSGDILGQLPAQPTPQNVAQAVGNVSSGQFMGARFGLTPNLLVNIASADPNDTQALWQEAENVRNQADVQHYTGSVLAVALIRVTPNYKQLISQIHLDDNDMIEGVRWQQHVRDILNDFTKPRRSGGIARDWSFGYIPLLSRFGQNISRQIQGGDILAVDVGSHIEAVSQLTQIFAARGRQNVALVGPSGAGKTTIIHAFAQNLLEAAANLPDTLKFRQVFILDSSSLIAAAPGRGELEELVMRILSEAYSAKNIIVCLDNAQLFFEEGVGSVNMTNVIQPIIEAGNLRIILSMDEQRYLEIGAKNPPLVNALNRISVTPASQAETMLVMQEKLLYIEPQLGALYTYQALKEAYRLSERYLHDIAQPGKSIKLLESAANYSEDGLVTMNSIQTAIEKTMDVKVSVASSQDDREKLLHLEDLIHERMINQKRAVQVVSDALRRARTGVRNENRPIGTFLFLGPTGVGKTELSKALADVYFGGEGRMIRLDLNEFVRPDDVARLIADGTKNSGSLTAQVMKQPFSVVLLDEIEKAAPEVLATLLQMLDEGILRDEKNREVSFRDAIIVATSNAGADRIREYIERGYDVSQFEAQFTDELISSGQFRPEFLNRFDEIVVFTPLSKDDLLKVVDILIAGVNKTLSPQHITVEVDQEAKQILVDRGYDPRLGARPMRRIIQKAVENTVAKAMLSGVLSDGGKLVISAAHINLALGLNSDTAD